MELNAVGWGALAGTGLVAGGLAALATQARLALALPGGVLAAWAGALVADRRRWRAQPVRFVRDLDRAAAEVAAAALRARGVAAEVFEEAYDTEDGVVVQRGVRCRQADSRLAEAVLDGRLA